MKPDKNNCLSCQKEISTRAKYCSDKCRKQYERNPDKSDSQPGQNVLIRSDKPNSDTDILQVGHKVGQEDSERASLSKTDRTFYDRAIRDFGEPYYNFDWAEREEKCRYCDGKFRTKLRLGAYCSYEHYQKSTSRAR